MVVPGKVSRGRQSQEEAEKDIVKIANRRRRRQSELDRSCNPMATGLHGFSSWVENANRQNLEKMVALRACHLFPATSIYSIPSYATSSWCTLVRKRSFACARWCDQHSWTSGGHDGPTILQAVSNQPSNNQQVLSDIKYRQSAAWWVDICWYQVTVIR